MIRVAVLAGGPDAEREVSLMSGREIAEALRALGRYDVAFHIIDRLTPNEARSIAADVFFPALHGPYGEGGPLQRLLEQDGRPFVGAGSRAAATAMDKVRTKEISIEAGVPTPPWVVLDGPRSPLALDPPLVLKPIDDGSSVDVAICGDREAIIAARDRLHARRTTLLAEKFIPGREMTVGIVGDAVGSLIEIIPAVEFYDYEAKYTRNDTRYTVWPKNLARGAGEGMCEDALRLFRAIGCRDLARVDFRYDDVSDPARPSWWMLEINTMPGFTSHSLVPMGAAAGGAPMPQLCERLVEMALARSAAGIS